MKDKKNPLTPDEKKIQPLPIELESDSYSPKMQKEICSMIEDDYRVGTDAAADWLAQKKKDIQQYEAEKPSVLEDLSKEPDMADRNLGIAPSTADSYQATLLATSWNPSRMHWVAVEENDFENRDNIKKFAEWAVSKNEGNVYPEIDDYIHNKICLGFSVFKVYWKVWYEWVDKRIPVQDKNNKFKKYDIKTVKERFEKGVLENIADVDDIVIPDYGKNLQEQSFLIHVLHIDSDKFKDRTERKIFKNIPDDDVDMFLSKIKSARIEKSGGLKKIKDDQLGIKDTKDLDPRVFPIDLLEWYGTFKKGKKTEKFRFIVEPYTMTLLAGKPLRKITRTGKIPFVGGPLIRRPGKVRGKSLMKLIAPIVNAINNIFNQASDFQFFTNCPFGFHRVTDEGYTKQSYKLRGGVSYPTGDDKPSDSVYFPNLQRSFVWEFNTINLLLEMLERLTGAASYFMSNQKGVSGTATRDNIINEKSETRFGLWVNRIIEEITEAITMFINMYQDWAPPTLGERVLGEDGKKIFPNLSVKTLRGNYDARMTPDIHMGSKTLKRQALAWAYEALQTSVWVHPQLNPKGNYNLTADTVKEMVGDIDIERYLGKEPKGKMGDLEEVNGEWSRFMQGDAFDPPEGATAQALQHLAGHVSQQEKIHELAEEYRPNFEDHLLKTIVNVRQFMKVSQQEKMANQLASQTIGRQGPNAPTMGQPNQPGQPGQPVNPSQPNMPTNQPLQQPTPQGGQF